MISRQISKKSLLRVAPQYPRRTPLWRRAKIRRSSRHHRAPPRRYVRREAGSAQYLVDHHVASVGTCRAHRRRDLVSSLRVESDSPPPLRKVLAESYVNRTGDANWFECRAQDVRLSEMWLPGIWVRILFESFMLVTIRNELGGHTITCCK